MVDIDFSKIYFSEYAEFDEELQMWLLKGNAPPDVVKLYEKYKEIKDEEKRTGLRIF
jgi:hypothetical protein